MELDDLAHEKLLVTISKYGKEIDILASAFKKTATEFIEIMAIKLDLSEDDLYIEKKVNLNPLVTKYESLLKQLHVRAVHLTNVYNLHVQVSHEGDFVEALNEMLVDDWFVHKQILSGNINISEMIPHSVDRIKVRIKNISTAFHFMKEKLRELELAESMANIIDIVQDSDRYFAGLGTGAEIVESEGQVDFIEDTSTETQ